MKKPQESSTAECATVCKRTTCAFYGSPHSGTCDYRIKTRMPRGCDIEGCDRYLDKKDWKGAKRGIYGYKAATQKQAVKAAEAARKKKKEGDSEMPKRHDWEAIDRDIAGGMSVKDAQEKHGFTRDAYYYHRNYSAAAKAAKGAGGGRNAEAAAPAAEREQPPLPEPKEARQEEKAPAPSRDAGLAKPRKPWYMDGMTQVMRVLDTVREDDSGEIFKAVKTLAATILCQTVARHYESTREGREDGTER